MLLACLVTLLALPWLISENQDEPTDAVGAVGVAAPGVGVPAVGDPLRAASLPGAPTVLASATVPPPAAAPSSVPRAVTDTPEVADTEEGRATFVRYDDATWGERTCAHRTLPFGTVLTVTNLNSGRQTTCVVRDRGPSSPGRVVDLDADVFAELADPSVGIIPVRISW